MGLPSHSSFSFSVVQSLWPGIIWEGGVNEGMCLLGEVLPKFFAVLDLEKISRFLRGLTVAHRYMPYGTILYICSCRYIHLTILVTKMINIIFEL